MGKGGSTSSVTVPAWMEEAAKRNVTRGDKISLLGPVPLSYGPTVAGFTDSQIAGFDNTSNTASAFGLNAPGAFSMGTPIEYANGVRGYSAAPLFEQKMNAFAEARPGQKSYIDSFFIDPFSGDYGYNATMPIDYQLAFPQATADDNGGVADVNNSSVGMSGGSDFTTYGGSQEIAHQAIDDAYKDYGAQITAGTAKPEDNPSYNAGLADAYSNYSNMTSEDFNKPGLTLGDQYAMMGQTMGAAGIRNVGGSYAQDDPTTGVTGALKDFTGAAMSKPTSFASDLTQSLTTDVDLPGNVVTRALNIGDGKKDPSSDSGYAGDSGDGCVIATHAVASGAFNHQTKRAAVVWCMNNLHDRWWGEAVRRGYRHLGRKKIEQGKAREHYDEFRRYIDFASGKKRTLRGALTFTLRTTQFFVVGMLNKEA